MWPGFFWVLKLKPDFPALFTGLRVFFPLIVKDDFNLYSF